MDHQEDSVVSPEALRKGGMTLKMHPRTVMDVGLAGLGAAVFAAVSLFTMEHQWWMYVVLPVGLLVTLLCVLVLAAAVRRKNHG